MIKWNVFDENNKKTYPPLNTSVLVSYNIKDYCFEADIVGVATLNKIHPRLKESGLYWSIKISTKDETGQSVLVKDADPYGIYNKAWFYVKAWSYMPIPYKTDN